MVGGRPTDIVILVMGSTGVGKSTFINKLLGENVMLVGHDIFPCTSTLEYAIIDNPPPWKGRRVIIVDTPGFDAYEDDVEILRRIAVWLASSYEAKMTLGGVIYLLSIADRMMRTTRKNLDMLRQLCGDKTLSKVVFGTTKWGEVDECIGEGRERQLAETFWGSMSASGSQMLRFDNTEISAQVFLHTILGQSKFGGNRKILNDNILRFQKEIVDLERKMPDTKAGKEMRHKLEQLREYVMKLIWKSRQSRE